MMTVMPSTTPGEKLIYILLENLAIIQMYSVYLLV